MSTKQTPLYPSKNEIKQAICRHGSVISAIRASDKFRASGEESKQDRYGLQRTDFPCYNHVVHDRRWDDTKNAWLIRNSWGKERVIGA